MLAIELNETYKHITLKYNSLASTLRVERTFCCKDSLPFSISRTFSCKDPLPFSMSRTFCCKDLLPFSMSI
jgi:hypothetical protein